MEVLAYPFTDTWWIEHGSILGGRYPGGLSDAEAGRTIPALLDVGIDLVVNLQERHEDGREGSTPYEARLARSARARGVDIEVLHAPIRDHGVPSVRSMCDILDAIDDVAARGGRAYVHCWGGHGRTGLVAGCLYRRRGMSGPEALAAVTSARAFDIDGIARIPAPQTPEQCDFVRSWNSDPRT